ncbi:Collagen alpha-1(IX) chain [Portunus trituberculatus]|uniref:Collagen alpha-1(IX) chain n=1 Tax=Portunus trituberculatus TaxID=210409 RepID=A0A5B7HVU1_PORTR|nr:Collagen alpha-1(IX) chain [Portunus trituberculatus]
MGKGRGTVRRRGRQAYDTHKHLSQPQDFDDDPKEAFNEKWHKLHFGVFRDRVTLHLDCERTTELPIDPIGPIDVNGNIYIAKQQGSQRTVPVR